MKHIILTLFLAPLLWAGGQSFRGITEPVKYSTISATVAGQIATIKYDEGAFVRKGDTILQLDKEEEELEYLRRKLIAESQVALTSAKYQVNTLKKDFEATTKLFETTQSVSEEEIWKKDLEYKKAIAEYNRLLMLEKKEDLEYKIARAQLAKRSILAPFSGVVVKIHKKKGESCNALEPLVYMVDVRKCRFITHVEASMSHELTKGKKVNLNIEGKKSSIQKEGQIEFLSPVVDASSGLREVKVLFQNKDGNIQPGVAGKMILASE